MRKHKRYRRSGFTLLEVVVALAMLALIAVPAVGLATMAVSKSKGQLAVGNASELKMRLDTALRAKGTIMDGTLDLSGAGISYVASEDLTVVDVDTAAVTADLKFYKISVKQPNGYTYTTGDPYRMVVYEVVWPYVQTGRERNQLFFTSIFRK